MDLVDHISMAELNPHNYPVNEEVEANLMVLYLRINKVRSAYGSPMVITSGLRSEADQMRINPSAPKSKHLIGAACDVLDQDEKLNDWCKSNEALLQEIRFWMEERQGGWQHFQTYAPSSGKLWFLP